MQKSNFEGTIQVTLGGTVSVNTLAKVGDFVGMYMKAGVSGDIVPFLIKGYIQDATKVTSQAWTVGDKLYWDNGNTRFTKTAQGNAAVAVAASVVGSGSVVVGDVILMGIADGGTEDFGATGIATDVIAESTSTAGVTVDGVLLKDGGATLADAANIIVGSTTGTKIATATSQKLGFWNTTPVVQPVHVADPAASQAPTALVVVLTNMDDGSANNTLVAIGDTMAGNESSNIEQNFDKIGDEINALVTDVANHKTAIDANNAAIDSILAQLATLGLQAAS